MKKATIISIAALAAGFAMSASAKEQPVGTLSGVKGNISIGGNGFVSKAGSGAPVVDGNTVLVSSNGRATVNFANGCSVSLEGGQHFTVDSTQSCAVLQASVKQMFGPYRVATSHLTGFGAAGGGGGAAGGAAGAGILAGITLAGAIDVANTEDKNSPN